MKKNTIDKILLEFSEIDIKGSRYEYLDVQQLEFCGFCNNFKPIRAHHCSKCNWSGLQEKCERKRGGERETFFFFFFEFLIKFDPFKSM